MNIEEIHSNKEMICIRCGDKITLDNWTGWECFKEDGKTTQPICKFCNMVEESLPKLKAD